MRPSLSIACVLNAAVGAQSSLFFADDQNGLVYRVRAVSTTSTAHRRRPLRG